MVKLVAIDMDGTLLDEDKELSAANIQAIQDLTQTPVKVVICTGRQLSGVKPYYDLGGGNGQRR